MAPLVDIVPDGTLAADGSRPRVAKFKRPMPPTFDSLVDEQAFKKGALAGACRIFCTQGWENTSSQLSVRALVLQHVQLLVLTRVPSLRRRSATLSAPSECRLARRTSPEEARADACRPPQHDLDQPGRLLALVRERLGPDPGRPRRQHRRRAGRCRLCVLLDCSFRALRTAADARPRPADDVDAVSLHLAIYEKRPDVGSVIHGHTLNARTFSMQGREIDMICQVRLAAHSCAR